ncbi:hypothetical protein ABT337_16700 [Saccharopolyspora hirsuta]|uniref:Uncharacterized protein n=1 Tax=Saccharopolyspora hirsuta TaxID=1837 RepID=A0A5M7C232_SACHI|nr:hypothetical protein [Saccharopolyspora hirsuta]KAA5833584.1 hypothetical protein F1721_15035 [Saccharopolyspora hirsuta]
MPVPSAVRERIRSFLDEDDEIRYVFPADVLMSVRPSVLVVVSRKAITVLSTGFWSRRRPKSVLARLPRGTVLGPVDVQSTPYFRLDGIDYEIDEEYVAVVNAADAEIASPRDFPPDPLPDL